MLTPTEENEKNLKIVGLYHLENGVVNFGDWSRKMIEDVGDRVKPHLASLWDDINTIPRKNTELVKQKTSKAHAKNILYPYFIGAALSILLIFTFVLNLTVLLSNLNFNFKKNENYYTLKVYPLNKNDYTRYEIQYEIKSLSGSTITKELKSQYQYNEYTAKGSSFNVTVSTQSSGQPIVIEIWKNAEQIQKDEISSAGKVTFNNN